MTKYSLLEQGDPIHDPFRRGLGYAQQWYDCLQVQVTEELEQVLLECKEISYPSDTGPNDLFSTPTPHTVALPALSMHMQKTPSGIKPRCCESEATLDNLGC